MLCFMDGVSWDCMLVSLSVHRFLFSLKAHERMMKRNEKILGGNLKNSSTNRQLNFQFKIVYSPVLTHSSVRQILRLGDAANKLKGIHNFINEAVSINFSKNVMVDN